MAQNGGYIIRDKKQIFPLMEIQVRHMKDKRERLITLQEHVLDTVNGFFDILRRGGDAEQPTADATKAKAKAKPALQHNTVQIWDVACDRTDKRCANHFGNRRFADIVWIFMAKNSGLLRQDGRRRVPARGARCVEQRNPLGRFLGRTRRSTWKQLNQDLAARWVSSILKMAAKNAEEKRKCDAIDGLLRLAGLQSSCCDNVDEPYGPVIHASDDSMNKANQDDCRPDMTNSGNVVASGSGDDNPFRGNPNKGGCGGDESPPGGNDTEEDQDDDDQDDDDQDDDNENDDVENDDVGNDDVGNAFVGEAVEIDGRGGPDDLLIFAFENDMDIVRDVAGAGAANEEEVEVDGSNNQDDFADMPIDDDMDNP